MEIAVIAGTGVDGIVARREAVEVATPYGPANVVTGSIEAHKIAFLRRHGPELNVPPHLINYRANMWALKSMGVKRILATAAVGSLRKDIPPGSLAVLSDFIDFTKRRVSTFFDEPAKGVVHTDFSTPYCAGISTALKESAASMGIAMSRDAAYLCVDGPRYESPAEIRMFAQWGADVVGMTGIPEVVLARELGICYGALAIVTNYAAGISEQPLSHEDVVRAVTERRQQVQELIRLTIPKIADRSCTCPF